MDGETVALLAAAGLGAGVVNAVAGGGSLITFPALLAAGYPAIAANVTNALAVTPGYIGGSLAYRRELSGQGARIRALGATAAIGATTGATLLLLSPASVFEAIVPWLILAACGLLAIQPRAAALVQRRRGVAGRAPALHAALFATAVYGGYFGAGFGIMVIAILGVLLGDELQRLNALKGLLALVVALVTAFGFALFGPIAWSAVVVIGPACLLGGVLGVRLARRLPARALRGIVIAYGVAVAIALLL